MCARNRYSSLGNPMLFWDSAFTYFSFNFEKLESITPNIGPHRLHSTAMRHEIIQYFALNIDNENFYMNETDETTNN